MGLSNLELEQIIDEKLNSKAISDYAPNGLQVEGKANIQRIVTGVTATLPLIEKAIEKNADAILVHHGYFWKSESPCIRGMKGKRIKQLLVNDINLFGYHLPLDVHSELGNNAQLAAKLGVTHLQGLEERPNSIPVYGELETPVSAQEFAERIEQVLNRKPILCDEFIADYPHKLIRKVGICTGGGQGYIDLAASKGCDAFISGEISEQTTHSAREQGIYYFACGHHATERDGVKALGEWLAKEYGLDVEFIDIDNPA
ncbi:Nif3-like dinuclear metal center hexameric protein [Actinobacillus equuli subsp. equuli]|uniref:GTP cyclohydrolase 1 type 2 homolog n=1 Tax=Actinobacillus equuli subsp. equuli TaxID=202947 RepID=A0A9X4G3V9_ACTEU|nr:Nif3-like dinuclear metal center hexameric protein [Actinobacillus equuli]MDE8034971.1 Nif3-like dinuclear metal center hexameric protein [Actinobacillus equuli subsp. equuli]MDG4948577.1 Nif3-like dinuclear metal center hexameric protein [Actinobacillus equuli subsp. haemolyticus]WGE70684.1 Nif3-like dinuclear metal center hexameric protein [Actinobacillus equuli subsp. haemolyticus]WGE82084.1 Nif3-like dinuclear metal center hexameric protein [Actinobacillus equuli subsp. haemolyticus]